MEAHLQAVLEGARAESMVDDRETCVNIVLQSVGTVSYSFIRSLSELAKLSDAWLSERILRAPGILFTGVPHARALNMVEAMRDAGLEVSISPMDVSIEEDHSVCDLAIYALDIKQMPGVVLELMNLLGVGAEQARNLLCASPPVVLGGITRTTARALVKRFEAFGAEVLISEAQEARFEVFVRESSRSVLQRVLENVQRTGIEASIGQMVGSRWYHMCSGLTRSQADVVWESSGAVKHLLRVVDTSLLRYDLMLVSETSRVATLEVLSQALGLSRNAAQALAQNMPSIVAQNVSSSVAIQYANALKDVGCQAQLELNLFQSYTVDLEHVIDSDELGNVLKFIGGLEQDQYRQIMAGLPARLHGPFFPLQARWLHRELKRLGARSRLVKDEQRSMH